MSAYTALLFLTADVAMAVAILTALPIIGTSRKDVHRMQQDELAAEKLRIEQQVFAWAKLTLGCVLFTMVVSTVGGGQYLSTVTVPGNLGQWTVFAYAIPAILVTSVLGVAKLVHDYRANRISTAVI